MIPKGQIEEGEEADAAALREFEEEVGTRPRGIPVALCRIRQKAGKWVDAFALEGDLDADAIQSMHFNMEYPPRSGQMRSFPEIDRAAWMHMDEARAMILPSQLPILDALEQHLSRS
jgi:predicted NUDIX family NTP pyrophosphohydrolase